MTKRYIAGALALTCALAMSACTGPAYGNRSLESVHQPVISHSSYTIDLATGYDGLAIPEQQRLAGWFDAMNLRYGDRISIEDPAGNSRTREDVSRIAARHGILLSDGAPVTQGYVQQGMARVVITRSVASVPGCPDWSRKSDANYANATSPGYGCGVNSNLAAMVANPEDLVRGQTGSGETVVMSSNKAIQTYRDKANTGANDLKAPTTSNSGGN